MSKPFLLDRSFRVLTALHLKDETNVGPFSSSTDTLYSLTYLTLLSPFPGMFVIARVVMNASAFPDPRTFSYDLLLSYVNAI